MFSVLSLVIIQLATERQVNMSRNEGIWVEVSNRGITLQCRRVQYVTPEVTRTSRCNAHATVEIPGNQANGEDLSGASGVVAQSPASNNDRTNSRH